MTTTREVREALRVHAISLHKLGWTQTAIAKETGVPRRTAGDWVGGKVRHAISTKSAGLERNGELAISSSGGFVPIFKSWCGRIEDFKPDDGIRFRLVLADPPWNISTKLGDFTFVDRNGKQHRQLIFDLWLAGETERAIAAALDQPKTFIHRSLTSLVTEKASKVVTKEQPPCYNVWNFGSCDPRFGQKHPGGCQG